MNRSQRLLAVCFFLIADATASNARAGVTIDASECKRQVDAWLNPNIDCTIHIHFDAFADPSVKGILLLVVNGSSCSVPLHFAKSDVYGHWISPDAIDPPALAVSCLLTAPGLAAAQFQTIVGPSCGRSEGHWACSLGMHGTSGLGLIGTALENYLNHDANLIATMNTALDAADAR